jgi:diguanylate cyclase (GGDEF)-like protein
MTVPGSGHHFLSTRRSVALVTGVVLTHSLLMWLTKSNPLLRANLNGLIYFSLSLVTTIGLFYIAFRFRGVWHVQVAWALLGTGLSLATVGTIIYTVSDILGVSRFPSVADAFYIAFYPAFGTGLVLMSWSSLSRRDRIKTLMDIAIVMLSAFLVFWVILIAPTLEAEKNAAPLAVAVAIAYPILDWALLFAILRVLFSRSGSVNPNSLLLMALAGVGQVIGDVIYTSKSLAGTYVAGGLVDMIYLASMGLLFLMIAFQLVPQTDGRMNQKPVNTANPQFKWAIYIPNLWVAVAFIVLIWGHNNTLPISFELLSGAVGSILGLVILRQIVVNQENERLSGQLQAELVERRSAEESVRKLNEELERRVLERTMALTQEITERRRAQDELQRLASTDPLTGLFNRRYFYEIADKEFAKSIRYQRPLSVIILDLDLFKETNDTFGHVVGDQALIHIGKLLRIKERETDTVARYGGEEFVMLLPETNRASAKMVAERLRKLVEDSPIQIDGYTIRLTASFGVTGKYEYQNAETFDNLISQADRALYKAKSVGRNRVVCYLDENGSLLP